MSAASLPTAYEPSVVFLSFLVAVAASYVALSLARRVHAVDDRLVAAGWCLGGSVAMGSGIWAMHFVAMLGLTLPVELGYALAPTALSWLVAVAVSALALWLVSGGPTAQPLSPARWAGGALAMGAGICAMHYIGMAALHLEPGIRWRPGLVALSVAVAVAAAAVALALFRRLQRLDARQALRRQWVAALVLAGGISGLHYTGMAAAEFPLGAVCTSLDGLRGDRLAVLLGLSTLLLLTMTFGGALLDERLQARTRALTRSLGDAERELHEAAQHDALTGLLNRQGLDGRLAALATGGERRGVRAALVYVNLDGFKALNEQHGLVFGDGVLHAVAQRLKGLRREGDLLARLGADEFALLLVGDAAEGAIDRSTAMAVARRVIDALRLPLPMAQRELRLAASAGVALFPDDGPHGQLLAAATAAARAAKAAGGAQAAAFVPQMLLAAREQLELRDELRQALEQPVHAELMLHYQPKVRSDDGRVVGVEALLRWQHPRRGMVSPTVFVPLAERFGLIDRLGAWVIDEACAQMRAWRRHGLHLNVAVNLSMHQLRQPGLVAHVQKALQRCAVEPASLTFEITESAAMTEAEAVLPVFDQLAALGTRLSIDDFGTGYSSLAYLRRLPSRQVKVDRSFVQDLDTCSDARAIVEAVIRLAHALGLAVVAEGVETPRQREILQHLGCDELQGYLFARPVPAATLQRWARGADLPALLRFDAANDSPRHDTPMLQAG